MIHTSNVILKIQNQIRRSDGEGPDSNVTQPQFLTPLYSQGIQYQRLISCICQIRDVEIFGE